MNEGPKTVFLRGTETELAEPVAGALLARGAVVVLYDPEDPARAAALAARLTDRATPGTVLDVTTLADAAKGDAADDPDAPFEALRRLDRAVDAVVHLHLPNASTDEASLLGHSARLRPMVRAAAENMERTGTQGIVINQFLMPTLLTDHPLASAMVEARNGIAGITRFACLRYGRQGIRCVGLLIGLLDLPSLHAMASERVNAAKTPIGHWITPDEVAGTVAFLSLDSGYMSGQMLVLDGGMTGGLNGV
jgi:NAD(P)-dependent dehydrogenase (short-subunit alcohol dehydrogenase family)